MTTVVPLPLRTPRAGGRSGPYRLYVVDSVGPLADCIEVNCASDAQALRDAHERTHDHASEVWQGQRLVGLVD